MLAEKDSERMCRLFSGRRFRPLSHFRVTTFDMGRRIVADHAFRHGLRFHAGF